MKSSGGAEQRDGEHIKPWQPWGKAPTTHTLSHFSSPCTPQVGLRRCSSSSSRINNKRYEFYFFKSKYCTVALFRKDNSQMEKHHASKARNATDVQSASSTRVLFAVQIPYFTINYPNILKKKQTAELFRKQHFCPSVCSLQQKHWF